MTDYKNKRGIPSVAEIAAIKPSLNNAKTTVTATSSVTRPSSAKTDNFKPAITTANNLKSAKTAVADEAWELEDDDDGWGEDKMDDLKKFDYKNTDLNKMTDYQLQRHKQNMDKDFSKNVLKPGDKGFEYDRRVDYSS